MWSIRIQYKESGVMKTLQIKHANDEIREAVLRIADDKIIKDEMEVVAVRMVKIHG